MKVQLLVDLLTNASTVLNQVSPKKVQRCRLLYFKNDNTQQCNNHIFDQAVFTVSTPYVNVSYDVEVNDGQMGLN